MCPCVWNGGLSEYTRSVPEASLYCRTEIKHGEMRTSRAEYILGRNTRSETRSCSGHCDDPAQPAVIRYEYGPRLASIHNRTRGYFFQLDLESRVYTAHRLNKHGGIGKVVIAPPRDPSRTLHVHTETIDTGERRKIFGRTARHVITRVTQTHHPASAHRHPSQKPTPGTSIRRAPG
jgi:hypothetical protein